MSPAMQPTDPPQYRSYLVRCWEECDVLSGTRLWRFSVEDARTGQRRGFANLTELTTAIQAELRPERRRAPGDRTAPARDEEERP